MAYKIEYGTGVAEKKTLQPRKRRRLPLTAGVLCVFLLMTLLCWPKGRTALREVVLPGDAEVTADALQGLASDLRAGQGVSDAVTAFCQQIIRESGH